MYYLMCRDEVRATFDFDEYGTTITVEVMGALPYGCTVESLDTWLSRRHSARHRKAIERYLLRHGIDTLEGLFDLTHGISVNDCYWVKHAEDSLRWEHVSPYVNPYDEVIQKLSFSGKFSTQFSPSSIKPELSTDGAFPKCWELRAPEQIVLYKCGGESLGSKGREPYCEVLASQVFSAMHAGIPYKLVKYKGAVASVCGLFSSEFRSFVQFYKFGMKSDSYRDIAEYYTSIGCSDAMRRMFICDAVTLNRDRHTGNHGILCNSVTNEIVCAAPAFDYNLALMSDFDAECVDEVFEEVQYIAPRVRDVNFDKLVRLCMTDEIYQDLRKLKGITLSLPFYTERFTEERSRWMNDIVNYQINKYIKMFE